MRATFREDEPVVSLCLLKESSSSAVFSSEVLPDVIPHGGLSQDRRDYLQKHVLEFCRPENRDAFKEMLA